MTWLASFLAETDPASFGAFAAGALALLQGWTLYRVTRLGDQVAEIRGRLRLSEGGE